MVTFNSESLSNNRQKERNVNFEIFLRSAIFKLSSLGPMEVWKGAGPRLSSGPIELAFFFFIIAALVKKLKNHILTRAYRAIPWHLGGPVRP